MKILQLGKFWPIEGGVEKVAYDLMTGLAARGVDCDMLCAATQGPGAVITVAEHARVLTCRTWRKVAATMLSPTMVSTLRRVARSYDVVHVHHPDPMACLALRLSGYRGRVVLHWHSDILKQRCLLRLYQPLQRWLVSRADVIVGTSPVYLAASPALRRVQAKTVCLPIGVAPVRPDAAAVEAVRRRYAGRRIVFTLGRLVPYKGYAHLVEAAAQLPAHYVVLIGGSGPLRGELQARIDSLGLRGRVELLGRVPDDELPALYGACDVFCLSSVEKTEAFGIVQIEAMSCGKPVVATTIPGSGVAWVNAHGVSGLNAEPANPASLARAIVDATADAAVYASLSRGAAQRYQQLFTHERMIDNCLNIYSRLRPAEGAAAASHIKN